MDFALNRTLLKNILIFEFSNQTNRTAFCCHLHFVGFILLIMMEIDDQPYADQVDEDGEEAGPEQADNEDEFETMLDVRPKDVWNGGGARKNEVVRELIKCFGSMVESHAKNYALPDHTGRYKMEDTIFEKLLDAPKYVSKAKRLVDFGWLTLLISLLVVFC